MRRVLGVPRANPSRFRWSYIKVDICEQKTSGLGTFVGERDKKWGKNSLLRLEKVLEKPERCHRRREEIRDGLWFVSRPVDMANTS